MLLRLDKICLTQLLPAVTRPYCLLKVSPNLTDVFFGCKWKDVPSENCSDLFSPILTEEGLCYTFNTLGADELFRVEK